MARPPSEFPTELELQILHILWQESPLLVRDIRRLLAEAGRDIAHTSAITMLNIMVKKGYLKRQREGKSYLFSPRVEQDLVSRGMLDDLRNRVFHGSAKDVMLSLFDSNEVSVDELKELRKLISRKVKEQSE